MLLVYLHDWRVSFFFSFFFALFSYLFFILSRPFGGCLFSFSLLSHFTSCYTFLKTFYDQISTQPRCTNARLDRSPLSIEACCEVALALNKVHSQWKLGRISATRHATAMVTAALPGQAQLTSSQPTATANASTLQNMFHFFPSALCVLPSAMFTASRLVSNRVSGQSGGPNAPYRRFFHLMLCLGPGTQPIDVTAAMGAAPPR